MVFTQIFSNANASIESTLAALDKIDTAAVSKVSALQVTRVFRSLNVLFHLVGCLRAHRVRTDVCCCW